jgi:acyl-CoA synthetase (NDP forming)
MSGNSKQRKRTKKRAIRVLEIIHETLYTNIRPMVKDECDKEFSEVVNELKELIKEQKRPAEKRFALKMELK